VHEFLNPTGSARAPHVGAFSFRSTCSGSEICGAHMPVFSWFSYVPGRAMQTDD
jgi:hypothetical protein